MEQVWGVGQKSEEIKEQTKNISKHKKRLSVSDTSCMVTFASSATCGAHFNPPVSSRPDPVGRERERECGALIHTFPAIIWLEICLVLGMGSNSGSYYLKNVSFLLMQGWWRMWKRRPTSSW